MPWLETRIWPAEARVTREDVYWGTRLACLEMIRGGTTRFWDMYWFQFEVGTRRGRQRDARHREPGLPARSRARPTRPVPRPRPRASTGWRSSARASRRASGRTRSTPSTIPRCASSPSCPRRREVPVQIHLSETRTEVDDCLAAHGCRPAEYLDRVGLLTERTVLAHGVWLDDAELALDRRTRRDHRHQPGVEHEARHRSGLPLPGGPGGRRPGRDRHRRRGVQQLARPARRAEAVRPPPAAHRGRRVDRPGGRGARDRDGRAGAAPRRHARRGRRAGGLRARRRRRRRDGSRHHSSTGSCTRAPAPWCRPWSSTVAC